MVFGPDSRDKTLRVEQHLVQQLQNGGYDHEAGLLAHAQSYYRKFRFADCCIHIARRFALYVSVYTTASMGPGMAGSGA